MTHHEHPPEESKNGKDRKPSFLNTPAGVAFCVFLAIAGVFLWMEHRVHIIGAFPLLLPLLICLGMHFFMHRGHGGHAKQTGPRHER